MADDQEHDYSLVSDEAFQRSEDRRRSQTGEQHPLRRQFEGMYEGRPELAGTPGYSRSWLHANVPTVPRFRGRISAQERERASYEGGRGFSINMTTHNYPGSINSANYGGTTNNYGMTGMPAAPSGPDAPWEPGAGAVVSASAPTVSFATPQEEPMPGMWGTAKEIGGAAARAAGRGMVRGATNVMSRWGGAKAKGTQFENTPDPFGGGPGVQDSLF